MKHEFIIVSFLVIASGLSSCATSAPPPSRCSVNALEIVAMDPLRYTGGVLCGEVFAAIDGRTVRLFLHAEDTPSSMDLVWLVTTATRRRLVELSDSPHRYYIEARIDPMAQCFQTYNRGDGCAPFRRPVFMHVLRAQRR